MNLDCRILESPAPGQKGVTLREYTTEEITELKRLDEPDAAITDEIRAAFKDVPDEELEREGQRPVLAFRQKRRTELKGSAKHS